MRRPFILLFVSPIIQRHALCWVAVHGYPAAHLSALCAARIATGRRPNSPKCSSLKLQCDFRWTISCILIGRDSEDEASLGATRSLFWPPTCQLASLLKEIQAGTNFVSGKKEQQKPPFVTQAEGTASPEVEPALSLFRRGPLPSAASTAALGVRA